MTHPDRSNEKRRRARATIRRYLLRYRAGLTVGALCLVVNDALLLAKPWLLKMAIDGIGKTMTRGRLAWIAGLIVAATLVSGVFRFLMRRIMIGISRKIEVDIRADFFGHLQRLSPSFYNTHRTGDVMALATNDLNAVRMLMGPAVMYSLNTVVVGGFSLVLMLLLSWKMTLAVLTPMFILIFVVYRSMKLIHRLFEAVQQRFAAINSRAQENLSGIRVVKTYAREKHEIDQFEVLSEDYAERNMKLFRVQSLLQPLLTTLAGLGVLAILLVGGMLVIRGAITLGVFVAFNGYLTMLVWPMIAIGWVMNISERGLASMQRMNEIFDEKPTIVDPVPDVLIKREDLSDHTIRFNDVSFAYSGAADQFALHHINLEIYDGETVAIVGPTGSGKSTLVSLIVRLYDPSSGSITIGGRPIRRLALADLRRMIGLVPQDIFLFSDTIRENISFGVDTLEDPVLRAVSRTASIEGEIDGFSGGFDSRIGERGINLSGGQKQRVAIARALAKEPEILVLDDALSSVDATTEEEILRSLHEEMQRRTAIVIAHRVSTTHDADRIVVLNDGRVADVGTHDQLLQRCGIYSNMYEKQMIMFDLEKR